MEAVKYSRSHQTVKSIGRVENVVILRSRNDMNSDGQEVRSFLLRTCIMYETHSLEIWSRCAHFERQAGHDRPTPAMKFVG